jgi:hypothetical protein
MSLQNWLSSSVVGNVFDGGGALSSFDHGHCRQGCFVSLLLLSSHGSAPPDPDDNNDKDDDKDNNDKDDNDNDDNQCR